MNVGLFSEEFIEIFLALHERGLPFAKTFVMYGAGFSLGKNFVKMMRGSVRFGVAVSDFLREVIVVFIGGYFIGGFGIGAEIFSSMGGEIANESTSMLISFFNALKINLSGLPEFVVAMSALLMGAFIGVIFGALFG